MGTGLGLFLVSRRRLGFLSIPIGGLLMGAAISGMHYLGMEAVRGCGIAYSEPGTIGAVTIAVVASGIALWFTFRKRGTAETLGGSLILGLTIASMHYTAMVATSFQMLPSTNFTSEPILEQDTLAFIIASVTFVICAIFLVMFASLAMGGAPRASRRGR
jgi:NO-binding membrane sensor protein with MHYT domain